MNNCDESVYKKICESGILYYPSNKHYDSTTSVNCDRCHKHNINVCIGWNSYDMCLNCVQEVCNCIDKDKPKIEEPKILQNLEFKPSPCSYLDSELATRMMQNMFF